MKNSRYFTFAAALLLMLPILTACRSDLCYNHYPSVAVMLGWEHEWERDYGMNHSGTWDENLWDTPYEKLRPGRPEWVTAIRYTEDGEPMEKTLSPDGGQYIVDRSNDKSMLLYNSDTEYIVLSDMAYLPAARATATTRSRSSLAYINSRYPNVRSMNPPDMLYAAYVEQLPETKTHEVAPVTVKMQPLVFTYIIRYEFDDHVDDIYLARGALAGMAESVYLRDGRTSDDAAILLYDCEVTPYGCKATVKSFGVPGFPDKYYGRETSLQAAPQTYTLNLEVMLKNGKTVEFNTDVTDQLTFQPKGGVIKVSGLHIEEEQREPDPVDSGFDVDVDDWGNHESIELPFWPDF